MSMIINYTPTSRTNKIPFKVFWVATTTALISDYTAPTTTTTTNTTATPPTVSFPEVTAGGDTYLCEVDLATGCLYIWEAPE